MANSTYPEKLPAAEPVNHWTEKNCFGNYGNITRSFIHRDYNIGMHTHDFIELNLVISGIGRHYLTDRSFEISRGNVFIIPPGMEHGYFCKKQLDVFHLLIHPGFISEYFLKLNAIPGFAFLFTVEPYFRAESDMRHALNVSGVNYSTLKKLLEKIMAENLTSDTSGGLITEAHTIEIIALLCRWQGKNANISEPPKDRAAALRGALELIASEFSQKLSLDEIAAAAHMEKSHFSRVFKKVIGISPANYLNRVRVNKGKQMLDAGINITQTAYDSGFYDSAHFSRTFKNMVGLSPSAYKNRKA